MRLYNLLAFAGQYYPDEVSEVFLEAVADSLGARHLDLVTRLRHTDAAALKLLASKKLDADAACNLYAQGHLSAEVLSYAILKANESRQSSLEVLLSRAKAGAAAQRKLTGRKVPSSVAARLVLTGMTLEATERLLGRSLVQLETGTIEWLLLHHAGELALATLMETLAELAKRDEAAVIFTAPLLAARADLRNAILARAEERTADACTLALACTRLDVDEQTRLAAAIVASTPTGQRDAKQFVRVACSLLDRPTTTVAVRTQLATWLAGHSDQLGWDLPDPELWPEVGTLAELNPRDAALLAQRSTDTSWLPGARAVQLLELAEHPRFAGEAAAPLFERLLDSAAFGHVYRSHPLHARLGELVTQLGDAALTERAVSWRADVTTKGETLAAMRAWAEAAEDCPGVELTDVESAHSRRFRSYAGEMPGPAAIAAAGELDLTKLDRVYGWDRDEATAMLAHLLDALGENREAWSVACTVMESLDGTAAQLAATALAASA